MTSAQARRIEAASGGLTAKERAIVAFGYWLRREEEDPRLRRHMPAADTEEFEKWFALFYEPNNHFYRVLVFWLEWLTQQEVELGWLESLDALLSRCHALEAALGDGFDSLDLPLLPKPGRGVNRTLPWADDRPLGDDEAIPEDWDCMRSQLIVHMRFAVNLRWGEVVAYERALAEYNALIGVEILHPEMQRRLALCRAKILELHAATEVIAGPFELPEPSEANTDSMRSRFDWEPLEALTKKAPAADPWKWMPEKEKAELAEAEERWVAEARGSND